MIEVEEYVEEEQVEAYSFSSPIHDLLMIIFT
jgi:hypothetical protein